MMGGRSVFPAVLVAVGGFALAAGSALAEPVSVTLRALPGQMQFDTSEFSVFAGDRVRLTFRNDDFMPHNVVVCLPRAFGSSGELEEDHGREVALAAWALGEAAEAMHWVPEHPRVLAATKMLQGEMSDTIEFTVPERPGSYPFVCTFPGHASMTGMMRVQPRVEGLRELRYRLFQGPFREFPDFSAQEGRLIAEGRVPGGLIDAGVGGSGENFAIEFEGILSLAEPGEYTFSIAGGTGPVLLINGEVAVDNRGVRSWQNSASRKVSLPGGEHRVVLRYWHRRDARNPVPEVTLLWSGRDFKELPLSTVDLIGRHRQEQAAMDTGMPLEPEDGRPAFYRNYLAGVMPSGFGVGYPGGANLTWDPVRMNVGSIWAGAFFDVKRHRTRRGGMIRPAGFAEVQPAPGFPFRVLEDASEMPPGATASGVDAYRFLGYSFDALRRPTFRYRFGDMVVTDTFTAEGDVAKGDLQLRRTIALRAEGTPPRELMFRLIHGTPFKRDAGGYVVDDAVAVGVEGGLGDARMGAGGKEVLLPVVFQSGRADLTITYRWIGHAH